MTGSIIVDRGINTAVPNANPYRTLVISTHTGYNRYVIMAGKIACNLNRTFKKILKAWFVQLQVMHGSVYNNSVFAEDLLVTSGKI